MKTSILTFGSLFLLTTTVLSAPIQDPDEHALAPQQLGVVLGAYALVSTMTVGAISLATLFRGFIQTWQAKQVVTHTFEELDRFVRGLKGNATASGGVAGNLDQTMAKSGDAHVGGYEGGNAVGGGGYAGGSDMGKEDDEEEEDDNEEC